MTLRMRILFFRSRLVIRQRMDILEEGAVLDIGNLYSQDDLVQRVLSW
jgi:hypothetical protein